MRLVDIDVIIEEEFNKWGCDPRYFEGEPGWSESCYLIERLETATVIQCEVELTEKKT